MPTNETIKANLPFPCEVIATICPLNREAVAMVKRDHALHPFATYRVDGDGHCYSGRYHATHNAAALDLIMRA